MIKNLVVPHVSITGGVHEFPVENQTIAREGFAYSIVMFQNGRVLISGFGDGMVCICEIEQEECIQIRSKYAGAFLEVAVYKVPCWILFFRFP